MRPGQSFEEADVASFYVHRPAYPRQIFEKLVEISPGRGSLLDLGCGTGKIAHGLARHFGAVTGVDASDVMLRIARAQTDGRTHNIMWICSLAESAELPAAPYDLVVAAASIHWMDHAIVFPKLREAVRPDHVFAVVEGDGAFNPPWQSAWDSFLARWIFELKGETYEPGKRDSAYAARMSAWRSWIDVAGDTQVVSDPIEQSVTEFVACQHSRDTFAPSKLGGRIRGFDQELIRLLRHYQHDGMLTYSVKTTLTWGSIKS